MFGFKKVSFLFILLVVCFISIDYVYANDSDINIDSGAAVLIDAKSGQILYGKNESMIMYPASITKIATAIYAIEKSKMDEIVTISEKAADVGGTTVFLVQGEQVPMEKLIVGMVVNSGNDAAYAIAEHIDGSVETFSTNINQYLEEKIGVTQTHFTNPHGLFDADHVTTAVDMAKITQYAMKNAQFREIFQIIEYDWNSQSWDTTLINHHRLLKGEFPYEGINGGKNGYVRQSGHTLVTTAERDNMDLIAVTLSSSYREVPYTDTIQLLDYGFENFKSISVQKHTTFENENGNYNVPNTLYFTVPKNEPYTEEVDNAGTLSVKNDTGEVLAEFQLEPIIPADAHLEQSDLNVKSRSGTGWWDFLLPVIGVIFVVFIGFTFAKWKNGQRLKNQY